MSEEVPYYLRWIPSCSMIPELPSLSVSDCNWTRTHNHLIRQQALNHLAKLASLAKWLVLVCELSGCRFESSFSHLNFRFHACFEQGVPWHSANHRVWTHSETRTWHNKNIQSLGVFFQDKIIFTFLTEV